MRTCEDGHFWMERGLVDLGRRAYACERLPHMTMFDMEMMATF